ncbi:hypothetical protein E4U13_008181 [Claviceps humidiphila]|uniref:Uncharacterized protein n=1 Tax=Claviceps humidiphila TaxID=1294629 RepID=A0A9P7TMA7_9HYPO|nr:hypothetical protein E4U13_008181 [Claviceps humidiphila]
MVFYGNAPVATPPPGASPGPLMVTPDGTRAETGSATRREIWRRTLDISFTRLPTLSEFADSLPRLATWAGLDNVNVNSGSSSSSSSSSSRYTWRSASVYVLYANSKGGVAIRAGTGPVSNENVLRTLRVPKAGAAEAGEGEGDATRQEDGDFTTQEEWDAEMGRWEGGQVELHAMVCMEGGEDA